MMLITGSNGFVGKAVLSALQNRGIRYIAAVRSATTANELEVGDINGGTNWERALFDVDVVVHLAARVHILKESATEAEKMREVNVAGTLNLARQAVKAGVRRFVFVSTIKVMGESTNCDRQPTGFSAEDIPGPVGAYAVSKLEAEQQLRVIEERTGLEVVVVRPPLVYGPGVGANFLRLIKAVNRGIPLPLALVKNKRSMLYVGNLADMLITCSVAESAAGKTFLVSDGEDLSTPELLRRVGQALGKPVRLFPVPLSALRLGARIIGKREMIERLLGSLQVDMRQTCAILDWVPPYSVDAALQQTSSRLLEQPC